MSTQDDSGLYDNAMELKSRVLKVVNDYVNEKKIDHPVPAFVAFSMIVCELSFSANDAQNPEKLSECIDMLANTAKNFICSTIKLKRVCGDKVDA